MGASLALTQGLELSMKPFNLRSLDFYVVENSFRVTLKLYFGLVQRDVLLIWNDGGPCRDLKLERQADYKWHQVLIFLT
jgi:hypothetical protein